MIYISGNNQNLVDATEGVIIVANIFSTLDLMSIPGKVNPHSTYAMTHA